MSPTPRRYQVREPCSTCGELADTGEMIDCRFVAEMTNQGIVMLCPRCFRQWRCDISGWHRT
jgi:hypothetical protein